MAGVSQVKIGGIPLDIDPEEYVMISGRRRGSVHRTIDGNTVYQDRGFSDSDGRITLSGKLTDLTTLKALFALYRQVGTEHVFEDFKDNVYNVVFLPGAESFVVRPIHGSERGYEYTMLLAITSTVMQLGDG